MATISISGRLLQERDAKPKLPTSMRQAMKALASEAAEPVWKRHGDTREVERAIVFRVASAIEQSLEEINRPASGDNERRDIEELAKLARKLKLAIAHAISSQSMSASVARYELVGPLRLDGLPDVDIALTWHAPVADHAMAYPLAITDVLDGAILMAQEQLAGLPARTVRRRRGTIDQYAATIFIRKLYALRNRPGVRLSLGDIGHIATAVCVKSKKTFDAADVREAVG